MCLAMGFALIGFSLGGIYDYYTVFGDKVTYIYAVRYLFCVLGVIAIALAFRFREWVEYITATVLIFILYYI